MCLYLDIFSAHPSLVSLLRSTRWFGSASHPPVQLKLRRASVWQWVCRLWLTAPPAPPSALSALWPPAWGADPAALAWLDTLKCQCKSRLMLTFCNVASWFHCHNVFYQLYIYPNAFSFYINHLTIQYPFVFRSWLRRRRGTHGRSLGPRLCRKPWRRNSST